MINDLIEHNRQAKCGVLHDPQSCTIYADLACSFQSLVLDRSNIAKRANVDAEPALAKKLDNDTVCPMDCMFHRWAFGFEHGGFEINKSIIREYVVKAIIAAPERYLLKVRDRYYGTAEQTSKWIKEERAPASTSPVRQRGVDTALQELAGELDKGHKGGGPVTVR